MSDSLTDALKQLEMERQIRNNLGNHAFRIETLEKGLSNLAGNVAIIANTISPQQGKKPYKCPVCEGTTMPHGVDPTKITVGIYNVVSMQCPACKGEGIVWG